MEDNEVMTVVNNDLSREKLEKLVKKNNTISFIFSLKNRIGGLARALRVFQVVERSNFYSIFLKILIYRTVVLMLFI
jgi:hypothetical protein